MRQEYNKICRKRLQCLPPEKQSGLFGMLILQHGLSLQRPAKLRLVAKIKIQSDLIKILL